MVRAWLLGTDGPWPKPQSPKLQPRVHRFSLSQPFLPCFHHCVVGICRLATGTSVAAVEARALGAGIACEAKSGTVLISKVLAPAANRLGTIQRDIVVSLAPATTHSARQGNGTLLWDRFKVSFVLFIPMGTKTQCLRANKFAIHSCW